MKVWCKKSTMKMKLRFEKVTSNDTYMKCIRKFYEVAEPRSYDQLPEEMRLDLEASQEKLKAFCWELCMEAINRDFCTYVSTGTIGNVGRLVYTALKS